MIDVDRNITTSRTCGEVLLDHMRVVVVGLDIRMCTRSASINDDPFSSVENPTDSTLNESDINRLKPTSVNVNFAF